MKTTIECIPCFVKQMKELVKVVLNKPDDQIKLLKETLSFLSKIPIQRLKPPQVAKLLYGFVREKTLVEDPYRKIKEFSNKLAKDLLPQLRSLIKESDNPFETALRLSIAGNIIDYGQARKIKKDVVEWTINRVLKARFKEDVLNELYCDIEKSKRILYIGDNAGEVFFDKLFIEQFPGHAQITFCVRGGPIINDATREDALEAGIEKICKLIDTGDFTPGVILEECSEEFLEEFNKADFIISKGQGNYETLSDLLEKKIYFLFETKCEPVSKNTGFKIGEPVILCNKKMAEANGNRTHLPGF